MIPLIDLAPGYSIPRVILGGWQLSAGHANRSIERQELFARWDAFLDQGFNTFDCADIYTGVEATIGEYVRRRLAAGQAHPKSTPSSSPIWRRCRRSTGGESSESSTGRWPGSASTGSTWSSSIGGTMGFRATPKR